MDQIQVVFEPHYRGLVQGKRASLVVGSEDQEFGAYDLILAGLSACFYATFLGIAGKMHLHYHQVIIDIKGEHREEPPTTLKHILLEMEVKGADPSREKHYKRAAEIAGKYCSVYQTLSKVAEMETVVKLTP